MANRCIKAMEKASKGDLTTDELIEIIEELNKSLGIRKRDLSVEENLFETAKKLAEEADLAAKMEKLNRIKNLAILGRAIKLGKIAKDEFGDASLALEAMMVGINTPLLGGRKSVDAIGRDLFRRTLGAAAADLREANLHGVWSRGGDDLERGIARELEDLNRATPTGKAAASADAKAIAKIFHKYAELGRKRENRAGALIRKLDGRITRTTHDRAKMERAGRDVWAKEVRGRLDWDKMEIAPDEREDFLTSVFEALTTGIRKKVARGGEESDLLFTFTGPGNLAKRASAHRLLLWKSADGWVDYNKKFGSGGVRETLVREMERAAQNTALMRTFGTNPRAMFETIQTRLGEIYRSDIPQTKRLKRRQLNWFMDEIDGTANIADNHGLAAFGRVSRAVLSMAKLGFAFISSFVDIAAAASELRFQRAGKHGPLVSIMDSWSGAIEAAVKGMTPGEMRVFGDRLGVGLDGLTGGIAARFSGQDNVPGVTSRMLATFFKWNLLGPWTDGIKRGVGLIMARDLADNASKAFGDLTPQFQRIMGQYGIDARKWEVARLAVVEAPDGRTYMLPGEIENVRGAPFKGLSKTQQQKLRDEVSSALSSFITDRVEFASPTPGARERGFIRLGLQPGTITGEAIRFLMQFKSFPITVLSRVVGRDVHSRGAKTLGDAFLKGEGDLLGIANFVAGAGVLGYFALQTKELARGKELRDNSPQLFLASMLQGGGLGIYGDFLLGESNHFGGTPLDTAAGPGLGVLLGRGGVVDLIQRTIQGTARGEPPDLGASLLRLTKSNLPFANLFYTKAALDYLIFFQLQEMTNPGYLGRVERRMKRENNQRFRFPPSRAIPRGGGSRIFEGVR